MNTLRVLTLISFFVIATSSYSQESLQAKYDQMLESTETFQQFKVIPRTTLNAFWTETADSLRIANKSISDFRQEIATQKQTIESLNSTIEEIQTRLDESLNQNDSISLLGISFSKVGYHILVWTIIAILAVLGIAAYFMFVRSNSQTTRFKRELDSLRAEFDAQKNKALETQLKLKRELQTAMNQLNERR